MALSAIASPAYWVPERPGGNPVIELMVFGNRPSEPVITVLPLFVTVSLAMTPKLPAVPSWICARVDPTRLQVIERSAEKRILL